ncbi:MAG TPA: protein kinase [Myxococcales bacterium]|nr:protein kinase [Myxococcales bacterium]
MSEVWLARRAGKRGTEQLVVKRILPHLASDPLFVQMFLNEARIAARFGQKNIARIHDFGEAQGSYFIAMEYIHGEDLGRVMRKAWNAGQWIAQPVAMRIMSECLEALAYAHAKTDESGKALKVVHRDISPQNILIGFDGDVKLVDFGIAKAADVSSTTQAGAIKGKFAYMSPEQAVGKPLDHRADIFSAGLVLYELLTGVRPLQRSSEVATHVAAMECKIDPPSAVSETPSELDAVVMKALAKSPGDRYPDADAFQRAITKLCARKKWDAGESELSELMRILFADRLAEEGEGEAPPPPAEEPEAPEDREDDRREAPEDDENDHTAEDFRRKGRAPPPPRREASRALRARDREDRPPVADEDGSRPLYRTGESYAAPNEPQPGGEPQGRDIYGEDDPLPEPLDDGPPPEEDDAESTRAGPPRKLVFIDGPDKGMVKRFAGVRMVLGRTESCTVMLSDKSVSRRHLELVQGERGVLLRDLGSGNGTKVNGERADEKILHHEDVVEIGQTQFQFIDESEAVKKAREAQERKDEEERRKKEEAEKKEQDGEAAADVPAEAPPADAPEGEAAAADQPAEGADGDKPAHAPAQPPAQVAARSFAALDKRQRMGVAIGGGFMALLMVLLLYFVFRTPPPPPVDPVKERAAEKMRQARMAISEDRFEDAMGLIETAERLVPGIDEDGLAGAAKKERGARKSLAEAKSLIEQQRFEDARAELARTPEASAKSADEHEKLLQLLNEREWQYHEKNLDDALAAGDLDGARREMEALPPEHQAPYAARMQELEDLAAKQEPETRPRVTIKKGTGTGPGPGPGEEPRGPRPGTTPRGRNLDNYFLAVQRKFQAGDYDRALMECDRVLEASAEGDVRTRAEGLKRDIPAFQRNFEDGVRKAQAGAKESALRPLQKAHDMYQRIGLAGGLGAALDEMLLDSLLASARSAALRGDLGSAAISYRDAQKLDPRSEQANTGIKLVVQKAEELYLQAYQDKDTDPSAFNQKMRIILEIVPKSSETYRKASTALGLGGGGGKGTKGRAGVPER